MDGNHYVKEKSQAQKDKCMISFMQNLRADFTEVGSRTMVYRGQGGRVGTVGWGRWIDG
jgi:hypothetical protein